MSTAFLLAAALLAASCSDICQRLKREHALLEEPCAEEVLKYHTACQTRGNCPACDAMDDHAAQTGVRDQCPVN